MTKKILSLLPCLLIQYIVLFANPADSIQAAKYLEQAAQYIEQSELDKARQAQELALEVYKKNNRLDCWLDCHIPLAYVRADVLKQPFEAKQSLELALSQAWRMPETPKEWEQWIRVQMNIGHICQWYTADYANAVKHYEVSFRMFVGKLGEKNDRIASYIYHQLGNAYTRLGDYERAEKMLRRGIEYGQRNHNLEIGKYGDLAIVLLDKGKSVEALAIIEEGLKTAKMPVDASITARFSEARAWLNLGEMAKSRKAAEQGLQLIGKLDGNEQEVAYYKAGYFAFLAELEDSLSSSNAERYYKKAVSYEVIAQGAEFSREVGKARCNLAGFYLQHLQPSLALREFQKALQSVIRGFKPKDSEENPPASMFFAENTIVAALIGKAQAFKAMGKLDKALECYELIPLAEAQLRSTHAYESSSLLALKDSRQRFHQAIDIAWQLFERSNGNPQYAARAFRLTEMARGMLLLQSLVQSRQFLPDDIREKDYELRVRMAWLEHEIAALSESEEGVDEQKIAALGDQLFDLKLERQKLLADFPSYNNPDSLFLQVLAAKDVRSLLRPGQAMADFFLTETTAYIFSFDAEGEFRWRKSLLPTQFRDQTRSMVSYLWEGEEHGREVFLGQAWLLDSLLLQPELARWGGHGASLIIVPDDVLMLVPFETLLSRAPLANGTWRDQPWLLIDHNIGYAYSATLLNVQHGISETHEKTPAKPLFSFGGFAPSYDKSTAYKLRNTRPMVQKVCNMLGGEAWLDEESTEARFKTEATHHRTLLLAMHGISDAEHPELSRLLFGDPGPDSLINNNILYASELQIMRLQADLVVLSACHSGSGKIEQGEGVYSLARAFAAAQVPAMVMSLWLLHENTAPPLVEAFFKHLQEGMTKDEALRRAKLEFLKKDENFEMTHPFFWAGLVASGDMRALELPVNTPVKAIWWLLLGFGAVVVAGYWWQKKRSAQVHHL